MEVREWPCCSVSKGKKGESLDWYQEVGQGRAVMVVVRIHVLEWRV